MKISHIEHLGIAVKSIEKEHRRSPSVLRKSSRTDLLQHRDCRRPKSKDRFPEMRRHQNRIVGTDQSGQYHRQFH